MRPGKQKLSIPRDLFPFIIVIALAAIVAAVQGSDVVTVNPGDEAAIATNLNSGHNVALVAGQTYTLSASEQIRIAGSGVELNGNGATLSLDNTFNNYFYNPLEAHGDVNSGSPAPKDNAFGVYIASGSANVTIKNLKITRQVVSGSVVRSIGVVKASDIKLQNIDITGNTIGPVIDIVDSERVTVTDANIHDITAEDQAVKLNLTGAGKPNLTGILVDDVDLLRSGNQRKDENLHSHDIHIANNVIKNFTMHSSIFTALQAQLGVNDTTQQTDGINIQRGFNYKILNNVIVNVDEGVDTFGYHGLIRDNTIKLNPFVAGSAALKFIHGASHNLVLNNTIINRNISSILDSSTQTNLTGSQGTFGNVVLQSTSTGSGTKLHRISRATGAPGPEKNFMLKNSGGTNSSDFTSNDPNIYFTTSTAEPDKVLIGDFDLNGQAEDLALYFKSTGKTDLYLRTASAGFDGYVIDTIPNGICASNTIQGPMCDNLSANGCLDASKNMTHAFTGRFFAQQPDKPDIEFLFLNASGPTIVDRFQRNNGEHSFSQRSNQLDLQGIPSTYNNILVGDFNGDQKTDVFFHAQADGANRLYRNDDTAASPETLEFARLTTVIPASDIKNETNNLIVTLKTGDFNGDGKTDLFWLWKNGQTKIKLGDSNLSFSGQGQLTSNFGAINNMSNPDDIQVFDYNQDGYADVLFKMGNDTRRLFTCETSCASGNLSFSYKNTTF